jgi:hypothetical protein
MFMASCTCCVDCIRHVTANTHTHTHTHAHAHHGTPSWVLCSSAQSNMFMSVAAATTTEGRSAPPSPVVQNVTWPTIRVFSVITHNASTPQRDLPEFVNSWHSEACAWSYVVNTTVPVPKLPTLVCQTWQTAAPGVTDFFSAECFYTAQQLVESGAIPPGRTVGLIHSAYVGTAMETWIPPEALDGCPAKEDSKGSAAATAAAAVHVSEGFIPTAPSCLWNSMIYPIAGYGLRAVLHNQIEANM